MAKNRDSTTYGHKLTKDNKQDIKETYNKYTKITH
jgi:hypothetical protein